MRSRVLKWSVKLGKWSINVNTLQSCILLNSILRCTPDENVLKLLLALSPANIHVLERPLALVLHHQQTD